MGEMCGRYGRVALKRPTFRLGVGVRVRASVSVSVSVRVRVRVRARVRDKVRVRLFSPLALQRMPSRRAERATRRRAGPRSRSRAPSLGDIAEM